jgi:hypothetical protein
MTDSIIYAEKALSQIPRLLSNQDRNPFSPTYGCFNREYWLNRTRDFPDGIAQYGTLSLALIWAHKFPDGEKYYRNDEIKKFVIAGITYWMKIQHRDGSFDEFYQNERGWAGPTGFLLYAMVKSYELLGNEFPAKLKDNFLEAAKKSALFLATREEPGVLSNHYAMALLPIYATYSLTKGIDCDFNHIIIKNFKKRLESFFHHCRAEGWSLEYDGADPGYLSGTISFLSKLQKYMNKEDSWYDEIQNVIDRGVGFSSYFLYPNGSYAGTIGSRQTLHFYTHGFELQGKINPLAAACAFFGRQSMDDGGLVTPEIQDERYYLYRIPELLESYIDACDSDVQISQLPFQKDSFEKYFSDAKIFIRNTASHYALLNLAKAGTLKIFNKVTKKLVYADDGLIAITGNKVFTTQWIDNKYEISNVKSGWIVSGRFHHLKYDYFNAFTMTLFKMFMLTTGWNAYIAGKLKGLIRNLLVTRSTPSNIYFKREFIFSDDTLTILNAINTKRKIDHLRVGGQFATRYVPQSRYFQIEELANKYIEINNPDLTKPIVMTINLNNDDFSINT